MTNDDPRKTGRNELSLSIVPACCLKRVSMQKEETLSESGGLPSLRNQSRLSRDKGTCRVWNRVPERSAQTQERIYSNLKVYVSNKGMTKYVKHNWVELNKTLEKSIVIWGLKHPFLNNLEQPRISARVEKRLNSTINE